MEWLNPYREDANASPGLFFLILWEPPKRVRATDPRPERCSVE